MAYANLSQVYMNAEDAQARVGRGERALALAESLDDPGDPMPTP